MTKENLDNLNKNMLIEILLDNEESEQKRSHVLKVLLNRKEYPDIKILKEIILNKKTPSKVFYSSIELLEHTNKKESILTEIE